MIENFQRKVPKRHRLYQAAWFMVSALFFESALPFPTGLKVKLLRLFGARLGAGIVIRPNVSIKTPKLLTAGDHVWIGRGVVIDNDEEIRLGSNVCLSQQVMLISGNHDYHSPGFEYFGHSIVIGNHCWMAARAMLLAGAEIQNHCLVGPGVIFSGQLPAHSAVRLAQAFHEVEVDPRLLP